MTAPSPADKLLSLCFSPDSRRVAFLLETAEGQSAVAVDMRRQPAVGQVVPGSLCFGPDGASFGFLAQVGDKDTDLVMDGKRPKLPAGSVLSFRLARGGHYACLLEAEGKATLVVDGRRTAGPYAGAVAGSLLVSEDGRHAAFILAADGRERVVADGKLGLDYDAIIDSTLRFDAAGQPAYAALSGEDVLLVLDGKISAVHNHISGPLVFGPDGKRLAYQAFWGRRTRFQGVTLRNAGPRESIGKPAVILDGVEAPGLGRSIVFSPDGTRVAWQTPAGQLEQIVAADNAVVVDGQPGPVYALVDFLQFSPDSRHVAYLATEAQGQRLVVDGISMALPEAWKVYSLSYDTPEGFTALVRDGIGYAKATLQIKPLK